MFYVLCMNIHISITRISFYKMYHYYGNDQPGYESMVMNPYTPNDHFQILKSWNKINMLPTDKHVTFRESNTISFNLLLYIKQHWIYNLWQISTHLPIWTIGILLYNIIEIIHVWSVTKTLFRHQSKYTVKCVTSCSRYVVFIFFLFKVENRCTFVNIWAFHPNIRCIFANIYKYIWLLHLGWVQRHRLIIDEIGVYELQVPIQRANISSWCIIQRILRGFVTITKQIWSRSFVGHLKMTFWNAIYEWELKYSDLNLFALCP